MRERWVRRLAPCLGSYDPLLEEPAWAPRGARFLRRKVWVRHDDHTHLDFARRRP